MESPLKTDLNMGPLLTINPLEPPKGVRVKLRRYVFYDEITRFRVVDDDDETNYLNVVDVSDDAIY